MYALNQLVRIQTNLTQPNQVCLERNFLKYTHILTRLKLSKYEPGFFYAFINFKDELV